MSNPLANHEEVARRLQITLLGMIKCSLRAVYFNIENETIKVKMLYDQTVQEEEIEIASEVETEMIATYYGILKIDIEAVAYAGVLNQAYKGYHPAFVRWERS